MYMDTLFKVIVIIILFAILGFNVFTYLAKGTDFLSQITKKGGETVVKGTKNIAKQAAEGGEDVVDSAISAVHTGTKTIEKAIDLRKRKETNNKVSADSSMHSTIQSKNKAGYCYIGTWKDFRSCAYIRESDICMSGEIFPTKDICINPTLRQ